MTNQQIQLVQQSFSVVAPIAQQAASLFYSRLFQEHPELRPLFRGNMNEQGAKLMQMLAAAVNGLQRPHQLIPVLEDLGRRHAGYGVLDEHYDAVGAALLWTLETGLGPVFTKEIRDAWAAAFGLIASVMKRGAAGAQAA